MRKRPGNGAGSLEARRHRDQLAPVCAVVNDATVEKLGELLNQNPNGLLLFRDELSGFLRLMDRPGHENDRGFYCEAWNGTGAYTYDRLGRGTLRIEAWFGETSPGPSWHG